MCAGQTKKWPGEGEASWASELSRERPGRAHGFLGVQLAFGASTLLGLPGYAMAS